MSPQVTAQVTSRRRVSRRAASTTATTSVFLAFLLWRLEGVRRQGAEIAEVRAREAVSAERTRLAREVHDILAYSQSAQIVHLEGVRLMLERAELIGGAGAEGHIMPDLL